MGHAEAVFGAAPSGTSRSFVRRVAGAVRLDPDVWDEIGRDRGALGQALLVVVVAAATAGAASGAARATLESALAGLGAWLVISGLLWGAANGLRHPLGLGAALRVVGFAMAPLALIALAAIPVLAVQCVARLLALALFFAALLAGTRQRLGVETMRATLVCATAGFGLLFLALLAVTLTVA
jgi:hypothetical protein